MFNFFKKGKKDIELFYNTDVHCHILPGVDHGSQSVEQSLEMLEAELKMGIKRVMCTSHVTSETFENTPESLTAAFQVLKKAVDEAGMDIEIYPSAEYRIDEYWEKQWEKGAILPMPGKFLLMENSFQQELLLLDDLMFDLMIKGYKPILAHPERYGYYAHRHQRLEKLHGSGVKFQINLLSLAGFFGQGARESAMWMVKHGMVDLLGTDMHNMEHAYVIQEYLRSKDWAKVSKIIEPDNMNDWVK